MFDSNKRRPIFNFLKSLGKRKSYILFTHMLSCGNFAYPLVQQSFAAFPSGNIKFTIHSDQQAAVIDDIVRGVSTGIESFRISPFYIPNSHQRKVCMVFGKTS